MAVQPVDIVLEGTGLLLAVLDYWGLASKAEKVIDKVREYIFRAMSFFLLLAFNGVLSFINSPHFTEKASIYSTVILVLSIIIGSFVYVILAILDSLREGVGFVEGYLSIDPDLTLYVFLGPLTYLSLPIAVSVLTYFLMAVIDRSPKGSFGAVGLGLAVVGFGLELASVSGLLS